jgi:hypothetical protein
VRHATTTSIAKVSPCTSALSAFAGGGGGGANAFCSRWSTKEAVERITSPTV